MTSGAMYSSVPTNEFVLKSAIQDFVSNAKPVLSPLLLPVVTVGIIVGFPPNQTVWTNQSLRA